MPRVRRALLAKEASDTIRKYLQSRLWHWATRKNYALSTDYAIHLLNKCSKDPLGLCVGGEVANLIGQKELAERCEKAAARLTTMKNVRDISYLIQGQPSAEEKKCLQASLRANKEPLVEVLEPLETSDGRGVYARKRVSQGTCLLVDEPFMVQSVSTHSCAHCLVTIPSSKADSVVCPHCDDERYCSQTCQEAAWTTEHSCCCASVNPQFSEWRKSVRETLSRDRVSWIDPNSSYRAGMSCLAVGKLCCMATVQQCHPLSLPGVNQLRGIADYDRNTALAEIGSLAVFFSTALRQPYLFIEEILSLFALLQTNEFLIEGNTALYPILSILNHSCDPNCAAVSTTRAPTKRQLIALRDLREGEQIMIDYNSTLTSSLKYEDRKALCAQRHFTCFCAKCVRKE